MSARHQLQDLLTHPHIWRGGQASPAHAQVLSSGDAQLDHALAGGWPLGSLCELLTEQCGLGEFRLLLPALSRLTAETNKAVARQVMLLNPPYIPYAPALLAAGVDISRVLVTRCADSQDFFWAMEQALRSRTCAAVLGWCEAADDQYLRRLQLAAEASGSWTVLLRPGGFRRQRSPASLRLYVSPSSAAGLDVAIIKQRGGRPKRLVLKA